MGFCPNSKFVIRVEINMSGTFKFSRWTSPTYETAPNTESSNDQPSIGPHPRRLLNFIIESNVANLSMMHPRRATDFFKPPQIRLACQQNSKFYKGPKLYNTVVNDINSSIGEKATTLHKRYLKPFKNLVKKYLLDAQKQGSHENWSLENFKLYNL